MVSEAVLLFKIQEKWGKFPNNSSDSNELRLAFILNLYCCVPWKTFKKKLSHLELHLLRNFSSEGREKYCEVRDKRPRLRYIALKPSKVF